MALNSPPDSPDAFSLAPEVESETSAFRISAEPLVPHLRVADHEAEGLPRSYGSETLCLLARDPHSVFAFWDIDWQTAFGQETPRQTTVYLKVINADGSEQTSLEVEPLAGSCDVRVPDADASYYGEIGYLNGEGIWNLVARSETILVPPEIEAEGAPPDFATVPFHLSFQRMIETLRHAQHKENSLTAMLEDLRERATATTADEAITAPQRELLRVMEEAVAKEPPRTDQPDLWTHHSLERVLGFGSGTSDLSRGFGGSSRD